MPSLCHKWRKRYGGLDGSKLLKPEKEDNMRGDWITRLPVTSQHWESKDCQTQWRIRAEYQPLLPQHQQAGDPAEPWETETAVWNSGIQKSDPRIKDCYLLMKKVQEADGTVDRNTFHRCMTAMVSFILKALQGRFVIPDFSTFSEETQKLFLKSKQLSPAKEPGSVSGNSGKWGVSICTVDGQRLCIGDSAEPCVLREISWSLIYGIAVDQLSVDYVHRHVGVEDFSKYESAFTLTKQGVPHSPLTETGTTITTSLLQLAVRLGAEEDEKYESRFPESIDINTTLDLLHQCSSTEVTCESGAAMAATLANGGLCPLSDLGASQIQPIGGHTDGGSWCLGTHVLVAGAGCLLDPLL
ncbi:hypothetical protein MATL_G00101110 [Megalops atlanticus]|uniref:glutaminase n=1 Tax=Megalops atlanticus TaxID=7932 RepID=A0A9D3Q712_MEGAT|nr:hypothetical protein MATL_G00101110 [Megalops atlanticus]